MEKFINDIYSIFDLINKNDESRSIIKTKTISKQYLAYYIYRIITKFYNVFQTAIANINLGIVDKPLDLFMKYLRIPKEHNREFSYPLAGKMTNDEQLLDMIILTGIDIFSKTNEYLKNIQSTPIYKQILTFINQKSLSIIIQDLIDLQKLIPGISVSSIRPNYLNDEQL